MALFSHNGLCLVPNQTIRDKSDELSLDNVTNKVLMTTNCSRTLEQVDGPALTPEVSLLLESKLL
jgi:hypothetical protein